MHGDQQGMAQSRGRQGKGTTLLFILVLYNSVKTTTVIKADEPGNTLRTAGRSWSFTPRLPLLPICYLGI